MRRTGRWQNQGLIPGGAHHRCEPPGCSAIKTDFSKSRRALPFTCGNDIPESNPMRKHTFEARSVIQLRQRHIQRGAKQPPELIARMRVILRRSKRCFAWEAAENQYP